MYEGSHLAFDPRFFHNGKMNTKAILLAFSGFAVMAMLVVSYSFYSRHVPVESESRKESPPCPAGMDKLTSMVEKLVEVTNNLQRSSQLANAAAQSLDPKRSPAESPGNAAGNSGVAIVATPPATLGLPRFARVKEVLECEDMYTQDAIMHWREGEQELCLSTDKTHPVLESHMKCYHANHMNAHNKFAPDTCRFSNLVKRSSGWTSTCAFNAQHTQALGTRWYDSGIGAIVGKMHIHQPSPEEQVMPCRVVETRPTLMFMREQGTASNMFHEMAQILALYITKHVHGVPDDTRNVLLLGFDRHHRNTQGRCDELLVAFSNTSVVYDEDVAADTCFTNAMLAFAGEESIAFWHKFVGIVPCHDSPLMRSFQHFLLTGFGMEPVVATEALTLCWIVRGAYSRSLNGEADFVEKIRSENTHFAFQVAEFGQGDLTSLRSQMLWSQKCNVMVGAHGAGLTHSMWMPEEGVVVEILPPSFGSYRTLVRSMGHQYLFVPAASPSHVDWNHVRDVVDAAMHVAANMHVSRSDAGLSHPR